MAGTGKPLCSAAGAVLCSAAGAVLHDGVASTRTCDWSLVSGNYDRTGPDGSFTFYSWESFVGTGSLTMRITNNGNSPLIVTDISTNVNFSIDKTSGTIPAGGHLDVTWTMDCPDYPPTNYHVLEPVATSNKTSQSGEKFYLSVNNYLT
jgi:hypothetical protein